MVGGRTQLVGYVRHMYAIHTITKLIRPHGFE